MATELQVIEEPIHYKYGGSVMARIALCPGSPKAIEACGEVKAGAAAERGTRIHSRIEQFLSKQWVGKQPLQEKEEGIAKLTTEKIIEVMQLHGYTRDEILCEKRVTLPSLHPQAGGTLDVGGARGFSDLLIVDAKLGYTFVAAIDNPQLAFYALGLYLSLDEFTRSTIERICMYIIQTEQEEPYTVHVRPWFITVPELMKWFEFFQITIARAEESPDLLIAGEHCEEKYCAARSTCPAYKQWLNDKSAQAFGTALIGQEPTVGRGTVLANQLKVVPLIEKWIKAVKEDAKSMLISVPGSVPGYVIADSYGNRVWKNEKDLAKMAKAAGLKLDDFMPRSAITPAAFERLLKATNAKRKAAGEEPIELNVDMLTENPKTGSKLAEATEEQSLAEQFAAAL